ncbi:MAG TPA: helix-turn-helix transcriptional regulator [Thermoanaerobaculia bacterium]|nr:helix-turn-helix transcriptional regulator [Thermoanaerobaculia bacterium]
MKERAHADDLGLLVLLLRSLHGWGQDELAAAAGVDPSAISRHEGGLTKPFRKTLEKLARAAGVPMSLVHACLLPALRAARAAAAPLGAEASADLAAAAAALDQVTAGAGRSAMAAFLSELEPIAAEPWRRAGPPVPEDRLAVPDLWQRLADCTPEQRLFLVERAPEFQTWPLAEWLCKESELAAADRAERAGELARLALRVAQLLPGDKSWRSRVEGYALAFVANAQRVANDLPGAEQTLARAWKLWQAGTDAGPGLLAEWRLFDLEASLRRGQRLFAEALERLDRALALAPPAAAGRVLLKRGYTLEQMGQAANAIDVLRQAAPLLDQRREPRLVFGLRFNLATCLCQLDDYAQAAVLLPQVRQLALALRNQLDLVRVGWLEGKVAAGLGRTGEAAAAFEQVRREFLARQMGYDFALATLELAVLHLEQGRTAEVRALAADLLWLFEAQQVHLEALKALEVFRAAAARDALTVQLARRLADYLQRSRRDPELRFDRAPHDRQAKAAASKATAATALAPPRGRRRGR